MMLFWGRLRHGNPSKPICFSFELILVSRKLFFLCPGLIISLDLSTGICSFLIYLPPGAWVLFGAEMCYEIRGSSEAFLSQGIDSLVSVSRRVMCFGSCLCTLNNSLDGWDFKRKTFFVFVLSKGKWGALGLRSGCGRGGLRCPGRGRALPAGQRSAGGGGSSFPNWEAKYILSDKWSLLAIVPGDRSIRREGKTINRLLWFIYLF